MHWGLQALIELVPACGPSGKRRQAEGIFALAQIKNHCHQPQVRPYSLEKLRKVCIAYTCCLCSHCLAEFLIAVGVLAHPPLPPLGDVSVELGPPGGTDGMRCPASKKMNLKTKLIEINPFPIF